jgi:tRNA(Ile2) C34 agmatinyltransferase TiaS
MTHFKTCKRCNTPFITSGKYSKICEKCKYTVLDKHHKKIMRGKHNDSSRKSKTINR